MKEPNSKLLPNIVSLILCSGLFACALFYVLEFIQHYTSDPQGMWVRSIVIGMYVGLSITTKNQIREVTRTQNKNLNIDALFVNIMCWVNILVGTLWIALRFPASIAHNYESYVILWTSLLLGGLCYYLISRKNLKGIYPKDEVFK